MPVRAVDDKPSDTLVVVSDEGFWTGSSTLPHLHQPPLGALASTTRPCQAAAPCMSARRSTSRNQTQYMTVAIVYRVMIVTKATL
jgi:hypothetical protein